MNIVHRTDRTNSFFMRDTNKGFVKKLNKIFSFQMDFFCRLSRKNAQFKIDKQKTH